MGKSRFNRRLRLASMAILSAGLVYLLGALGASLQLADAMAPLTSQPWVWMVIGVSIGLILGVVGMLTIYRIKTLNPLERMRAEMIQDAGDAPAHLPHVGWNTTPFLRTIARRCLRQAAVWQDTAEEAYKKLESTNQALRREVSNRLAAETELQQLQHRFELAIRAVQIGLWVWEDLDSEEIWCSPACFELLGQAGDASSANYGGFREHIHPDDEERLRLAIRAHVVENKPYDVEIRMRVDQGYRWFRFRGVGTRDDDGRVLRMAGTVEDIEESRRIRRQMEEQREHLALTVEATGMGTWRVDARTREERRDGRLNHLLGNEPRASHTPLEELFRLIHPEDRALVRERYQCALAGGKPFEVEYRLREREDGQERILRSWGTPLMDSGESVACVCGATMDVTEERAQETEREQLLEDLERSRTELLVQNDRLQQAKQYLRDLYDQAPVGYITLRPDGIIEEMNDTFLELIGLPRRPERPLSLSKYIAAEDRLRVFEFIRKEVAPDQSTGFEISLRRTDGTSRKVMLQATALLPGRPLPGYRMAVVDVTERWLAQQNLEQSEARLRYALDAAKDGLWDWNLKTNAVFYSRPYFKMLGHEPEGWPATVESFIRLLRPDHRDETLARAGRLLRETGGYEIEVPMVHADGSTRWILSRGSVVEYDDAGEPARAVGIHTDMTERRKEQERLRRSEKRYRMLAHETNTGFVIMDDALRVVEANKPYAAMAGFTDPKAMVGACLLDWTDPAHHERKRNVLARLLIEGAVERYETTYLRPDGTRVAVEVDAMAERLGTKRSVVAFCRDETRRKEAEQALRAAISQLQRTNQELEQFTYLASHDLQEPLRKIQAFGDRLHKLLAGSLDERGRNYLDRMLRASHRMRQLITDLLNYSRSGREERPQREADLDRLLEEALENLESAVETSGAVLERAPLPRIVGDGPMLRQVLQNLVANGIKYRRDDTPPRIQIRYTPPRPGARSFQIAVEDNGIGIDPRYAETIFRPFKRLHSRSEYEGTGIGLAICKKVIERHGGTIHVEPAAPHGSRFVVELPATLLEAADPNGTALAPAPPADRHGTGDGTRLDEAKPADPIKRVEASEPSEPEGTLAADPTAILPLAERSG